MLLNEVKIDRCVELKVEGVDGGRSMEGDEISAGGIQLEAGSDETSVAPTAMKRRRLF